MVPSIGVRRALIGALAALGLLGAVPAQAWVVAEPFTLDLLPPAATGAGFEMPFWVVPGGQRGLTVTTAWTYACTTAKNPLTEPVQLGAEAPCALTSRDFARSQVDLPAAERNPRAHEWGRNYNGTLSAHVVPAADGPRLVSINHGETKNERVGGNCGLGGKTFWNTIRPDQAGVSGFCDGGYTEYWPGYHGLVTMQWSRYDAASSWGFVPQLNEGPIVWPANGYSVGGAQSSAGVRHPHGFQAGGYLWVFYKDESLGTGNLGPGIRVARAPVADGGVPGTWQTYCGGVWVDALPIDFDQDPALEGRWQLEDEWAKPGGCASPILPVDSTQISFAVAAKADGSGYLGIEETVAGGIWQLRLWQSADLVHWTSPQTLRTRPGGWDGGDLHYPVFLSADAWSSERVDPASFYLLGAAGGRVRAMHVQP